MLCLVVGGFNLRVFEGVLGIWWVGNAMWIVGFVHLLLWIVNWFELD